MAGMLPGVEMARRRRASHHCYGPRQPSLHQLLQPSSAMGETALKARRKLEDKLRIMPPSPSPSPRNKTNLSATKLLRSWYPKLIKRKPESVDCLHKFKGELQIEKLPCS